MLKIHKWAENKPIHIALSAQQLALVVEKGFKILPSLKNNEFIIDGVKIPSAEKWLSFYRDHRHLDNWLISKCEDLGGVFQLFGNCLNFISTMNLPSHKEINEVKHLVKQNEAESSRLSLDKKLKNAYEVFLDDFQSEIQANESDNKHFPELEEMFFSPESLFIIKVIVPCTFLYGESPIKLLRKARLGDIDSIDKILRLDKAVLCDSRISQHIYQASLQKNPSTFERLTRAIQGGLSGKINKQRAKFIMAGLISVLSEIFDHRLSAPEIQNLFDAIATDLSEGEFLIDTDLPDSPEAFSKAVQRERAFWKKILPNGQK